MRVPVFNRVVWGEPLNLEPQNLALRKLYGSLYHGVDTSTDDCHKARV